ncbi:MAG: M1 family metallopeptidase [Clostridiales bacterium]|nr:M1 family metallopeptidase [Clostridiales bacterium]
MKRILCILLVVCLLIACACLTLVACKNDKMKQATKNGDNYTIVASYDDQAHVLSATQTVTLTNRSENSFTKILFHIYANQYREDAANSVVPNVYVARAYPNGKSYGDIAFDSVKVDGTAVAYTIEGQDMDILSVPLNTELFPDQKVTVEMTYEVTLANIMHRLGYTDNAVNLGNFYPVLCHIDNGNYTASPYYNVGDPFVTDVANYNVSLTLPENYIVASTGNLEEARSQNGTATYTYSANAVRDFAFVLSQNFKKLTSTVGDTQVNYYYFADADAETSLATAVGMLDYLNKNVGKYPYAQYSVVETDFCYGGMEYPCLTMITSGSSSYQEAIAHETAHQWFYGIIGNDQINNAWMDEGLSEYVTYLYMDSAGGKSLNRSMMGCIQTYTSYVDVLSNYYGDVDRSMRAVHEYKNDNEYVIFTYVKGSLMFNSVYEAMGSARFWKALSNYFDEGQYTVAEPSMMVACFVNASSKEIGSIFSNFLEGKEIIGKVTD